MKLTFYGGAKIVTGSNYLLQDGGKNFLVDCGLFQGSRYADDLNYEKFNYDPKTLEAVFITHSHTDHTGRLPKLYKEGFRGVVYATGPTMDIMKRALPDNFNIMKEESRKTGQELLYSSSDLESALSLIQGVNYEEKISIGNGTEVIFHDAGHILGSSIIEFRLNSSDKQGKIYFSGDLGNPPTPLLNLPFFPPDADYLVVESAYGSRIHEDRALRGQILRDTIRGTISDGGTLLIPSFAMERTQELLFEINNLINKKEIERVPIFVDSPLAIKLTEVYKMYPDYFNKQATYLINSGDDVFNFPGLKFTPTTVESKAINDVVGPKVIIAGSGMSNGGRILHHELRYLSDPKSTILFVGYQVKGTLGRRILEGEKVVNIFGQSVPVNCRVQAIGGYSAHADQEMLLKWVKAAGADGKLKKVFVVQGEEDSADVLAGKIKSDLGMDAFVPGLNEGFDLEF